MTRDELLSIIDDDINWFSNQGDLTRLALPSLNALRAVVELHKPEQFVIGMSTKDGVTHVRVVCTHCELVNYPCPTIQAIDKEMG